MGQIHWKRRQMHAQAKQYGLTDKRTVMCSQELDELLNKLQHLEMTSSAGSQLSTENDQPLSKSKAVHY
nr:aspartyl-phosphate phosphatase Spo0E family protein [Bacillus piscicola]